MYKFSKLGLICTVTFSFTPVNAAEMPVDFEGVMLETSTVDPRTSVAITDTIEYINVEVGETLKAENGKTWKAKESGPIFLIGCTATELSDYILLRHKDVPVFEKTAVDRTIFKALIKAYLWQRYIKKGKYASIRELAEHNNLDEAYVRRIINLNYLSPKIKEMILDGTQPSHLKLQDMIRDIPTLWEEQEKVFIG